MMIVTAGMIGLCLILSVISAISNRTLPDNDRSDHLSALDKARVSEAMHLKTVFGNDVWRGLKDPDIPIIVWNESYEFLVNYKDETPPGWTKVTDDDLNGNFYFHRKADEPQNFAVQVGNTWVASMASKQTTDVFLIKTIKDMLPSPIKQVFPYRLIVQPSETQIGGVLHEVFHVYQYQNSPTRMDTAESAHQLTPRYEAASEQFNSEWKKESALLADALKAKTREEKIEYIRQFLSVRDARRKDHQLDSELIEYERWLEWEEGTAKYIELAFPKLASGSPDYQPISDMNIDLGFKEYQNFGQRWSQEMIQLRYQTTSGESQLYMTGMAQAFLLDDLMPDWKDKYWDEGVFLEDLLRMAVAE